MITQKELDRIVELQNEIKDMQKYEDNWNGEDCRSCFEGEVVDWEDRIGELNDCKEELAELQTKLNKGKLK